MLLCIAHDPGARLRDIAAHLGITERSAHSTVTDLAGAGYLIRQKDGRRNRYQIQARLPAPGPGTREPAIEQVLALFAAQGRLVTGPARRATLLPAASASRELPDPAGQQPSASSPPGRADAADPPAARSGTRQRQEPGCFAVPRQRRAGLDVPRRPRTGPRRRAPWRA